MGPEWVAIIGLIALFVVGTAVPINMGALGFVAAWMVGMWSLDMDEKDIVAGVSSDLVLTLIGVTYLFAIARKNGTVDLIVRVAVGAVRGRVALIPWVMFAITGVLTAIGAVSPAACAIIGPIALGFAGRYAISPLMMGMMVVHGAQAGGFSPISIYGTITNQVMEDAGLPTSELTIFFASLIVNTVMAAILFVLLGGRKLLSARIDPDEAADEEAAKHEDDEDHVRIDQVLTLLAFVAVAVIALILDKNIGFVAITAAVALSFLGPKRYADTVKQIAWPTVLLVAGVSCYAAILTEAGLARVRRRLGRRPRRGRARRARALLRRRRGLGVRQLHRPAAGDHPDRRAPGRGRRHQRGVLRRGPRRLEHDRGRQPVLDQRCAHAREPAGLDLGAGLLPADPHLQRDRGRRGTAARLDGAGAARLVTATAALDLTTL